MKLAVAQMVWGALIVGTYSYMGFTVGWGYLIGNLITFKWVPICLVVFFALGLLVLGCGVAQYLKARKARIK
ncbi:hypothetical protein ES703_86949 [subsurface metagenome]